MILKVFKIPKMNKMPLIAQKTYLILVQANLKFSTATCMELRLATIVSLPIFIFLISSKTLLLLCDILSTVFLE